MSRSWVLLLAPLVGCSIGLDPYELDDTDLDVAGPDDTGIGDPIDTGDTADNAGPVADAGPDLAAMVGDIVHPDGSASFDPDGDTLTFAWEMTARPPDSGANLLQADEPLPRFYADTAGTFTLTLTVTDGELQSVDEVDVTVEAPNEPPVANAGSDQIVAQGDSVQLNGSGSADPEDDVLNFAWTMTSRPPGSTASLDDPGSPYPRFTADGAGDYTLSLVVDDGVNQSAADAVRVTAEAGGTDTGGDCGASCAAVVRQQIRHRLSIDSAASGPVLSVFGLALLITRRRAR